MTEPAAAADKPLGAAIVPVTPFQQNCTLLWCAKTKDAVVVDPGGEIDKLIGAAEQNGVTIKEIWLTHGHLDHAGGAAALKRRLGVPIIGPHQDDLFWLEGIPEHAAMYGWVGEAEACRPDRWLNDGDEVKVGEVTFGVAHCPGHTPGHVVFYNRDLKLALVGDVLFQGSVGRTDFPKGDQRQLIESITGKLWPLGDDMAFIPGHGPMSTFGRERQTNPFVADRVLAAE
jgi:glyoxylase-like metal-dependent hydrolase (beta-lactamase superfamily II)